MDMKKCFLLLAVAIAFAACNPKLDEKVVETYPDGKTQKAQYFNRKGTCVKEVELYETGQVKMEGTMKGEPMVTCSRKVTIKRANTSESGNTTTRWATLSRKLITESKVYLLAFSSSLLYHSR